MRMTHETTKKPKPKSLAVSEAAHAAVLKACPEGFKIRAFHEQILKLGLAAYKEKNK